MTTGDIAAHLEDVYDTTISRGLVSAVTEQVTKDLKSWQSRPLDAIYPVIIIDAIMLKVREGTVANRPVYVAMGVNLEGQRDVLGMWMGWMRWMPTRWETRMNETRRRTSRR